MREAVDGPDGETKLYSKASDAYFPYGDYLYQTDVAGRVAKIVYGGNDEVYIKNLVTYLPTETWATGKIVTNADGSRSIAIETPQYLCTGRDSEGEEVDLYLTARSVDEETGESVFADYEVVNFLIGDGSITQQGNSILTIRDDYERWYGYGDCNIVYTVFDDTPVEVPSDLTFQPFIMTGINQDSVKLVDKIAIAFDKDNVYLRNFPYVDDKMTCKGRIEGGKVVFDADQYLGIDETNDCFLYLRHIATENVVLQDEYGDYYNDMSLSLLDTPIVFDYDAGNKTLSAVGDAFIINAGKGEIWYHDIYVDPVGYVYVEKPAVPADPWIYDYEPYDEYWGDAYVMCKTPREDVDGKYIDPENLYFNIFLDGNVLTLTSDDYEYQTEDEITDIPFYYTDSYDVFYAGISHSVTLYTYPEETVAVQSIYKSCGEERRSRIYVYNINTDTAEYIDEFSKVEELAQTREVKNVLYTTMDGRRVDRPAHGIYLKTIVYTDGSVKTLKKIFR